MIKTAFNFYTTVAISFFFGLYSYAITAPIVDIESYKQGFTDGFREGEIYQKEKSLRQFQLYSDFLRSLENFKASLYTGEYQPYRVEVVRENGKLVVKKVEVEKNFFVEGKDYTVIPEGYWVYTDISSMPSDKVAFLRYNIRRMSYEPYTLSKILVATVLNREADAKYIAKKLSDKFSIPFFYERMEEFKYEKPELNKILSERIKELTLDLEAIKRRYENIREERKDLYKNLIYALDSVDYSGLSTVEKERLKKDLSVIIEMVRNRNVNDFEYTGYYCANVSKNSDTVDKEESESKGKKPESKIPDIVKKKEDVIPSLLSSMIIPDEREKQKTEDLLDKYQYFISVYYGNISGATAFVNKLKVAGFNEFIVTKIKTARTKKVLPYYYIFIPAEDYRDMQLNVSALKSSGFQTYIIYRGDIEKFVDLREF